MLLLRFYDSQLKLWHFSFLFDLKFDVILHVQIKKQPHSTSLSPLWRFMAAAACSVWQSEAKWTSAPSAHLRLNPSESILPKINWTEIEDHSIVLWSEGPGSHQLLHSLSESSEAYTGSPTARLQSFSLCKINRIKRFRLCWETLGYITVFKGGIH